LLLAGTGAAWGTISTANAGQSSQETAPVRVARTLDVSPRMGPPGTTVTLKAARVPAMTPVQLALGAAEGFEALAFALTSIDGDMEETVVVPAWPANDQPQRFLVFNVYFSALLAESAIFHVTDADGVVVRVGEIGISGTTCLTLEGDDGEHYRLTGATEELEVGARVRLEGKLSETQDACGDASLALELGPQR
jgi:hypothetical protein